MQGAYIDVRDLGTRKHNEEMRRIYVVCKRVKMRAVQGGRVPLQGAYIDVRDLGTRKHNDEMRRVIQSNKHRQMKRTYIRYQRRAYKFQEPFRVLKMQKQAL